MTTDTEAAPTGVGDAQLGSRGRRWPRVAAAVIALMLVSLLGGGIAVLAWPTDVSMGSFFSATPGVKVASDGYSDTKYVVDGQAGGVLHVSVRNNARVPITILGLDQGKYPLSFLDSIAFEPHPYADGKTVGADQPATSQVHLGPGEEAGVRLILRIPTCLSSDKGSSQIYDFIPIKIRRLGVTRSTRIPLDLPLWLHMSSDHKPAADCPGGG